MGRTPQGQNWLLRKWGETTAPSIFQKPNSEERLTREEFVSALLVTALVLGQLPLDCFASDAGVSTASPILLDVDVVASLQVAVAEAVDGRRLLVFSDGGVRTLSKGFPYYGSVIAGDMWLRPDGDGGYLGWSIVFDQSELVLRRSELADCVASSDGRFCLENSVLDVRGARLERTLRDGGMQWFETTDWPRFEQRSISTRTILLAGHDFARVKGKPEWADIVIRAPDSFVLTSYRCGVRVCWAIGSRGEVASYNRRSNGGWNIVGSLRDRTTLDTQHFGGEETGMVYDNRCGRLFLIDAMGTAVRDSNQRHQ